VFKNVYLTMSLSALIKTFPDARVVLVKRDFEAICASVYKARAEISGGNWWSIRPPFWSEILDKDQLEQTVYQCVRTKQLLDREIDRIPPDRLMTIDYERLCESPRQILQRAQEWAGAMLNWRAVSDLPDAFRRQSPKRLPSSEEERFTDLVEKFSGDGEEYLARVDEQVRLKQQMTDE